MPGALDFAEVFEENPDVIIGVWAQRMPGEPQSLPGFQMGLEVALEVFDLAPNSLDFHRRLSRRHRQPAQFRYVAFKGVNFQLSRPSSFLCVCNRTPIEFPARPPPL